MQFSTCFHQHKHDISVSVFKTSNNSALVYHPENTHHLIPSLKANYKHMMYVTFLSRISNSAMVYTSAPPHFIISKLQTHQ
jgi:hypothetical protein